jgi:hypothetical protein
MTRSTKTDKARQLNAAFAMLQRNMPLSEAMQRLAGEFDLITLKVPAATARMLRAYARSSGLTIGAIVTRALAAFLSAQRRHG